MNYYFQNDIDSVVFIGYKTEEGMDINKDVDNENRQEDMIPPIRDHQPPSMILPISIVSVCVLSLLIGLMAWKRTHDRQNSIEHYA